MTQTVAIQIDKGVPRPERGAHGCKYPFKDMGVGDSFEVKLEQTRSTTLIGLQGSLLNSARAQIGTGKIATRALPDKSGFRVWRIA